MLGAPEEDWPATRVCREHAVFADRLEDELVGAWPEVAKLAEKLKNEPGEWRPKSEDCYRQAAHEVAGGVPEFASEIVAAVKRLR